MTHLDDLQPGLRLHGILPARPVEVVQVEWHGADALTLTYRGPDGTTASQLIYRADEDRLSLEKPADAWTLDADGAAFQLAAEAIRISLAHLFDPFLALSTSSIEPLPHQIEAVYGSMLPLQPLRFLLADDPGAGKTIMAGLLCRELMIRGDVERCLVIAPGSLVEQWQDELAQKFRLHFDIATRELMESAATGNAFRERPLLIARMDQLSRSGAAQEKLRASEWDLIVVDEAHKMSAHQYGDEVKTTLRYELGKLCGEITRHLLLMTATPHNGKEADFRLFMSLVDPDRFAGKTKAKPDVQGIMRRYSKEQLLTFDGTRLFVERRASSPRYELSTAEMDLYERVTNYVRQEMNRAEQLTATGDRRGRVVGFALATLQRRLASSPAAIHESLVRRCKRLQTRLAEARDGLAAERPLPNLPDDFDEDDLNDAEREQLEDDLVDEASAARTIEEMEWELDHVRELADVAAAVRASGLDRKWEQLRALLDGAEEMRDPDGERRKLIIFTEHRDTLEYLLDRVRGHLGRPEAVVAIHGSVHRDARRAAQMAFTQDREVIILVATDAAGEGLNLQRAHLMVNYDLPWNPNRIEQRFGRIHRIGQTEVCHLWNLVAAGTREGDVFDRLFQKLEQQRTDLGDQVFDVLGEAFEGKPLRDLLIEAIQYGNDPERRRHIEEVVDATIGERIRAIVTQPRLASEVMTEEDLERIRDDMERAEARRLQPHYIQRFLLAALTGLGGTIAEREKSRFEVTFVPYEVRQRAFVQHRYERITFEKALVAVSGRPLADLCCPGHPLLDGVVDVLLSRHGALLGCGTVLVDPNDDGTDATVLVLLRHAIKDGTHARDGSQRTVSEQLAFVSVDEKGICADAGYAPYLDLRPATDDELVTVQGLITAAWIRDDLSSRATGHAIAALVPRHLEQVRRRVETQVDRTAAAVRERLEAEVRFWDHRANELKDQELAGKQPKLTSSNARRRADELQLRLDRRLAEVAAQRQLAPQQPVVIGGALVVPAGFLALRGVSTGPQAAATAEARARIDRLAVDSVLRTEHQLGRAPREMPHGNPGYDVESRRFDGTLLFIEVKGRALGATTVTVSSNEILCALNKGEHHILAIVQVASEGETDTRYVRQPERWAHAPRFTEESVNYKLRDLLSLSEAPS